MADLSRREFFTAAPAAAVCGAIEVQRPTQAWAIMAIGWTSADEHSDLAGEYPLDLLFYDEGAAQARCAEMIEKFKKEQVKPSDFHLHPSDIDEVCEQLDLDSAAPEAVTWDHVFEALPCWIPYRVVAFHVPKEAQTQV